MARRADPHLERKRALARDRAKRQRQRDKAGHRVGRFADTPDLRNTLCWIGILTELEADRKDGAEIGVGRLLQQLIGNAETFRNALRAVR